MKALRLLFLALWVSQIQALSLSFKPMVRDFQSNRVKLSDIAICQGDKKSCNSLLAQDLGEAPPPGMDRIYASSILQSQLGQKFVLQWNLDQSQCHLWRAAYSPDTALWSTQILAQAKNFMQNPEDSLKFELRWMGLGPLSSITQSASWEWPQNINLQNRINLKVKIQDKNNYSREVQANLQIRRWQKAPVAALDLAKGSRINAKHIQWIWKEQNSSQPYWLKDLKLLDQSELRQDLRQGQLLMASQFKKITLIQSGSQTLVFARFGSTQLEMQAQALSDGALGDTLKFRNLQSGKIVVARVNAQGQGEVLP